jgi:hypothetical protein
MMPGGADASHPRPVRPSTCARTCMSSACVGAAQLSVLRRPPPRDVQSAGTSTRCALRPARGGHQNPLTPGLRRGAGRGRSGRYFSAQLLQRGPASAAGTKAPKQAARVVWSRLPDRRRRAPDRKRLTARAVTSPAARGAGRRSRSAASLAAIRAPPQPARLRPEALFTEHLRTALGQQSRCVGPEGRQAHRRGQSPLIRAPSLGRDGQLGAPRGADGDVLRGGPRPARHPGPGAHGPRPQQLPVAQHRWAEQRPRHGAAAGGGGGGRRQA